ncbi:MAG TPA: type II secretion system protein [Edaphobacter sp.]|jgi:general secretion pathway protein G|nr:type II secretion system protein [Edaphobacter sp.]
MLNHSSGFAASAFEWTMWRRSGAHSPKRFLQDRGITSPRPRLRVAGIETADPQAGLTLIELIIVVAILSILATAAIPIARFQVRREKERELRRDLWEMRSAIDHYKDAADKGAFQVKADSLGYPPDLQTLVDGVDVQGKTVRFLRKIPTDPMTNSTEWGLRSNQDDPDSDSFGGQNVFDVHSKSTGTALDGSKYSTW